MKIPLIFTLLLFSTSTVFAQEETISTSGSETANIVDSESGKIENGYFICKAFDWKIKIPENYTITKIKEMERMESKGTTELKKSLPDYANIQKRSHLIAFEFNKNNTFSSSFNSLENTKKIPLEEHKNFIVALLKQSYSQLKGARFEFNTSDLKIGEHQFYKITVTGYNASNNQLVLTQIYYNSYIKNHLFGVLINYTNEKEGRMLEDNFLSSLNH
jgi:hypothetical protein